MSQRSSRAKRITRRFILLFSPDFNGWLIWDRMRFRAADGWYLNREMAADVAASFEREPARGDRDWYSKERQRDLAKVWPSLLTEDEA